LSYSQCLRHLTASLLPWQARASEIAEDEDIAVELIVGCEQRGVRISLFVEVIFVTSGGALQIEENAIFSTDESVSGTMKQAGRIRTVGSSETD
jgi:hypothetical protein